MSLFTHTIISPLEVLKMVDEGRSFKAVCGGAGLIHGGGHSGRSTREHSYLWKDNMLLLEVVEEGLEVRAAKVGDRAKASEQTAT